MKINGLILSAGLSSRMGEFKPLLLYNGTPFITVILQKLIKVCDNAGIVTGYKKDQVEQTIKKILPDLNCETERIRYIYNQDYEKGMFSSILAGLKKMADCDWLLYHFVDQPHIPGQFYSEFVSKMDGSFNWIQPVYEGKKGHPIILHSSIFSKILNSRVNSLKEISQSHETKKKFWSCKYPQVTEDIDTNEDYQQLT